MLVFDILPHIGLSDLQFGTTRKEARGLLAKRGFPLEGSRDELDYFAGGSISLEFEKDSGLCYIGTAFSSTIEFRFAGINPFDTSSVELVDQINSREPSPVPFDDYDPFFPGQIISLWDAQTQHDRYRNESRPVFAAFGIGDPVYKRAILALRTSL